MRRGRPARLVGRAVLRAGSRRGRAVPRRARRRVGRPAVGHRRSTTSTSRGSTSEPAPQGGRRTAARGQRCARATSSSSNGVPVDGRRLGQRSATALSRLRRRARASTHDQRPAASQADDRDDDARRVHDFMAQLAEHAESPALVLRLADGRCESVGEYRLSICCWRQGLPKPEPQYEIKDRHGARRCSRRLRLARAEGVPGVRRQGQVPAELERTGESVTDVVLREKRREELICELTGWRCIRIVWADLLRPGATAARIRALFSPVRSPRAERLLQPTSELLRPRSRCRSSRVT